MVRADVVVEIVADEVLSMRTTLLDGGIAFNRDVDGLDTGAEGDSCVDVVLNAGDWKLEADVDEVVNTDSETLVGAAERLSFAEVEMTDLAVLVKPGVDKERERESLTVPEDIAMADEMMTMEEDGIEGTIVTPSVVITEDLSATVVGTAPASVVVLSASDDFVTVD